jgi:hypothetical protein
MNTKVEIFTTCELWSVIYDFQMLQECLIEVHRQIVEVFGEGAVNERNTYIRMCIHTCRHAFMHACIHIYIHMYIHAYIHTSIHTSMHTYRHTDVHSMDP